MASSPGAKTCGAFRRSTANTSPAWRMCSTSMPRRPTPDGQWCASTKARCNLSAKRVSRFRPNPAGSNVTIMSIVAMARSISSFSSTCIVPGARSKSPSGERQEITPNACVISSASISRRRDLPGRPARHAREHGPSAGHQCLARLVQGTVCKILGQEEIKPHKVRYYLERRDAEFEQKMAEVLCVYREVQVLKRAAAKSHKAIKRVAIVSYDEKPGIQAIATTAPDLPPKPGVHATFARDYEYKRHGTLSLLAGIDLLTGKVHALVRDRHRSREFIEFLKCLDAAYPASTAIKPILDNHSAHISRETEPGSTLDRLDA